MFEIIRNAFKKQPVVTEADVIRAMFDSRNNRDLADLQKTNGEIRPMLQNSARVLKGEIDINTLIKPKS